MELKVFRDTLSAAGSFFTVKSEIPIETEILISDYLPQVFKIVKCFVRVVVLQKQLQSGRLTLDHVARFEKELEDAGIRTDVVSPKLLPVYAKGAKTF